MDTEINHSPPRVTVIIPTRERADTLFYTLQTVVSQSYANFRIIVSDNFSSDTTKDVVMSFRDDRIEYFNTGKRLSMSHNWEFALEKISEGYVTILGSDDGHIPGTCKIVNDIIKKHNPEALMSKECFYL